MLTFVRNRTIIRKYEIVLRRREMGFFGAGKELRKFNQLLAEIDAVYHETA